MSERNFVMSYTIDKNFDSEKFVKLRMRVCHDGESPNKTYFTKEVMEKANKESLEYIPILANVYVDQNGKPVIGAHDMHIEEDKLNDGESRLIYDEQPIGVVPSAADNNWTIEEFEGLNYTYVDAYVWRDYSNYAEQLIESAEDTKLSMEIDFPEDSISFDVDNNRYNISSYRYRGITLLNESLGTGMKKALATTGTFSENEDIKSKMVVLMDALQECLREYGNDKGDDANMKIDELLEKYSVAIEDLDFEFENLDDEALEEAFKDFAERRNNANNAEEDFSNDEGNTEVFEDLVCTFRISHDDIRYGIQSILNTMSNENCFYSVISVFDKYFYYCEYYSGDTFKQGYKIRKDEISLAGDPEVVYADFLTQEEKNKLENLRKEYSELKQFKEQYDAEKLQNEKNQILARCEYACLANNEDFINLVKNSADFTIEEITTNADLIFAAYMKSNMEFENKEKKEENHVVGINSNNNPVKKSPYGNLFA